MPSALELLRGDRDFYTSVAQAFLDEFANATDNFTNLPDDRGVQQVMITAHGDAETRRRGLRMTPKHI